MSQLISKISIPGTSPGSQVSIKRLSEMTKHISADLNPSTDTSTLGERNLKDEGQDVTLGHKNETSESKKSKSKKKKQADEYTNVLQQRLEKKKAERDEFSVQTARIDLTGSLLNSTDGRESDGWLVSGTGLGSRSGLETGSLKSNGGALGSGNPYGGTSELPMLGSSGYSQDMADSYQSEIDAQNKEAEWKAAEQQAILRDNAVKEAEQAQRAVDQQVAQQESAFTQAQFGSQQSEATAEVTFKPETAVLAEVSPEQIEASVKEAVNEAVGLGNEASREMLAEAAVKLQEVQMETQQARQSLATEAPKFSQDLSLYMEQFAKSDSQSEQSVARAQIESLLDHASEGLQEQVKTVRNQVMGMFAQSEAAWATRLAASDLKIVSAPETRREAIVQAQIGQGQQDSTFLQSKAQRDLQQAPQASVVEEAKVAQVLTDKGVI